jgi:hypothetical protein
MGAKPMAIADNPWADVALVDRVCVQHHELEINPWYWLHNVRARGHVPGGVEARRPPQVRLHKKAFGVGTGLKAAAAVNVVAAKVMVTINPVPIQAFPFQESLRWPGKFAVNVCPHGSPPWVLMAV